MPIVPSSSSISVITPHSTLKGIMKVFLIYSKADLTKVKRLRNDLREHGEDTWFDEDESQFGDAGPHRTGEGLDKADVVILFLSDFFVRSRWLNQEWRTQFFARVDNGGVVIVPVILDNCELPLLLEDKKPIDFSDVASYEANLASLLRYLQSIAFKKEDRRKTRTLDTVNACTRAYLDDLATERIVFPMHDDIAIVDSLKNISRSGKSIRLADFRPHLKARSIYDHLLSVAHLADCLLPNIRHSLSGSERLELARLIAYHELSEIVLGDVPTYTSLDDRKRNQSRLYAERQLRSIEPQKRERIADEFIWLFLNEKHRQSFETVWRHLSDRWSPVTTFFKMLDKVDPIVAIWRYLHHYKGKLGSSPDAFLRKMVDFFENPDVLSYISANRFCEELQNLVVNLQNPVRAASYYTNKPGVSPGDETFALPFSIVRQIVEGDALFHDSETGDATDGNALDNGATGAVNTGGRKRET